MSDDKLTIYKLPEELSLVLVAAFRTLERTINPVFSFPFKCNNCGRLSDAQQNQGPQFVLSKKTKKGMPIIIGVQCQTEGCGMTLKFLKPISAGDKDFPQRLIEAPASALEDPKGKSGKKISTQGLEEIISLLELE